MLQKIFIFCLFACAIGCQPSVKLTEKQRQEQKLESIIESDLPSEAYGIQDIGNEWYIFYLKIDSQERRFLWHKDHTSNGGDRGYGFEALTEITTSVIEVEKE